MIGTKLGNYRVLDAIGAGGMGVVYLARDERIEREVAIKVLAAGLLTDPTARARFRREAVALSKLHHPRIATIFEFGSEEDREFIVMEYVAGSRLEVRLREGAFAESEVLKIGAQLAEGLEVAHAAGVLHRDLKPSNLRFSAEGQLKILDFGLAKIAQTNGDPVRSRATTETAYQPYLEGRHLWSRYTPEATRRALQRFQEAARLVPGFALAQVGIADCYYSLSDLYLPPKEAMPKARAAAEHALEFDATLAEAHSTLAVIRCQYDWSFPEAEAGFRRAIALNSSYAPAFQFDGLMLTYLRRPDEAVSALRRAQELDPLSPSIAMTAINPLYYSPPQSRRPGEALRRIRTVVESDSGLASARATLGACLLLANRPHAAILELERALPGYDNAWARSILGSAYVRVGRRDLAKAQVSFLEAQPPTAGGRSYALAILYASLGNASLALDRLELARENRSEFLLIAGVDPAFDSLQGDPRFKALLRSIGLPNI